MRISDWSSECALPISARAGCALWLRSTQDDLQPVHPMEQAWCFQSHSDGTSRAKRRLGSIDDRYNPSQSASHRRQSAQKGALPRYIGRSRGGLTTKLHVEIGRAHV